MKKHTQNRFLIGSWVSFYPFEVDSYEYQLDQMKEAGLNFNIFPMVFGGGMQTPEAWQEVERQYAARDMFYCMNGGLNEEMMALGVEYAKGKSRCIGYHLVDEPGAAQLPRVGEMVRAYRAADPDRYPFVNLFPSYVGTAVMEGDYYDYCSRFVREAGAEHIEYLSHDFYPFHQNGTALSIFADMEVMRRIAFENGRMRTHGFPQSTAWLGTRMPNIDEMRWNVYGYLAYGFKALSWFNLVCPGKSDTEGECFRESVIYRDGTIRDKQLLKDFGALNREVLTLGDTLMKLDTVHAYHVNTNVAGVEQLPRDWMITPESDAPFLISHMVNDSGSETYVMLMNMSWCHPATATFALHDRSGIEALYYVSPFTGKEYGVNVKDNRFTETFRPGEGKLYRLSGNLVERVFPINQEKARVEIHLPTASALGALEISAPLISSAEVTVQITTNKKFTESRTTSKSFPSVPENGRLALDGTVGKYIRMTLADPAALSAFGWVEVRVRYSDEISADDSSEQASAVANAAPIHYDDLDFTALNEAIAVVEELNSRDYTPESWQLVQDYYDAAVAMRDCTYPQNAVTVAAWKLLDSVNELEPLLWSDPDPDTAEDEAGNAQPVGSDREIHPDETLHHERVRVSKGILPSAVSALFSAVGGLFKGKKDRKR